MANGADPSWDELTSELAYIVCRAVMRCLNYPAPIDVNMPNGEFQETLQWFLGTTVNEIIRVSPPNQHGIQIDWYDVLASCIFQAVRERGFVAVLLDGNRLRHQQNAPWSEVVQDIRRNLVRAT